jgi:flagellar hook-associated protein 1 FlgK
MASFVDTTSANNSLQYQMKMARDALLAQQAAMNTVSHNVANVNTEGYHRQRTVLEAREGRSGMSGLYGSGVTIQGTERSYNAFVTRQERAEMAEWGRWEAESNMMLRVEEAVNDLSNYGIDSALEGFWNAWADLGNDPDSLSSRTNVINKSQDLSRALDDAATELENLRIEANVSMMETIDDVNSMTAKIAELNELIYTAVARNQNPNDLMDQRDQLIKELSGLVDITIKEEDNGSVSVYVGADSLIYRNEHREIDWEIDVTGTYGKNGGVPVWADTQEAIVFTSGSLEGYHQTREVINDQLDSLDTFTDQLRSDVNDLHKTGISRDGSTNNAFFAELQTGSHDLNVSDEILSNLDKIAVGTTAPTGDNSLATQMFELQFSNPFEGGTTTFNEYFQNMVTDIGGKTEQALIRFEASDAARVQTENWQQSFTGVNLDEEMTSMITIEYAYSAASKVFNTVNEMMDMVVNGFN